MQTKILTFDINPDGLHEFQKQLVLLRFGSFKAGARAKKTYATIAKELSRTEIKPFDSMDIEKVIRAILIDIRRSQYA